MTAADAANRLAWLQTFMLSMLGPLVQRAHRNRLTWERLRGIAWEGWGA